MVTPIDVDGERSIHRRTAVVGAFDPRISVSVAARGGAFRAP
jgi:hypothetical protein